MLSVLSAGLGFLHSVLECMAVLLEMYALWHPDREQHLPSDIPEVVAPAAI